MNGELEEALKILIMLSEMNTPSPTFYIGSKSISEYLPGLEKETIVPDMGIDTDRSIQCIFLRALPAKSNHTNSLNQSECQHCLGDSFESNNISTYNIIPR